MAHLDCSVLQSKIAFTSTRPNPSRPRGSRTAYSIRTTASTQDEAIEQQITTDRRLALLSLAAAASAALQGGLPAVSSAKTGSTRTAGDFCSPSATEGFVVYKPDVRATPSLRAGVIKPDPTLYSFDLPPSWSEGTILNILSGNFCMPRCDEPWYETVWESKDEGLAQLVVSPLYRLVSKSNATLKDLGPPEQVLERVGPFITGNYLDSIEDAVAMGTEQFDDGRTYYTYELVTPYAKTGSHLLSALTIKGDLVYIFVVGGNEAQWKRSEQKLRHMLKSFSA